jgi:hypothetical protein
MRREVIVIDFTPRCLFRKREHNICHLFTERNGINY